MKLLVTGANGFLGSWLTRALINQGHDVKILLRPHSDVSELAGLKYSTTLGDVTDPKSLEKAFQDGVEGVFHLAGVIAYKKQDRAKMEQVNVIGTRNVLEAAIKAKVKRFLHLSSVVAVGASFSPDHILNESSPYTIGDLNLGYFETKRAAEQLVIAKAQSGELNAVMVNPSTIYGPADAKKGSRSIQVKVAQGKFPFYTTGGVSIVGVEDIIDGILKAWEKGRSGERYILSGENWTIRELFTAIAEEAGVSAPRFHLPNFVLHALGFAGDTLARFGLKGGISRENAWTSTMYHWFDNTKAKEELGFNPGPARLAIHKSVKWMKDQKILDS